MRRFVSLCVLAYCAQATTLLATQADSLRVLDDVVITRARLIRPTSVSKIPAPAREVPITIHTLSSSQLGLMGHHDVADAMRDVPGMNAFRDYGAFHMFYLRGFYQTVVLSDGMRDERHTVWQSAPLTGLSSVDRIEVLKGAASMTVGHSALGGVVNIVHKQPTYRPSFEARLSAGSWGTRSITLGGSGAIVPNLTLRADAELSQSDGWRDNWSKIANGRIALDWRIARGQKLSFAIMGNKDQYKGDYGQPHLQWDVYDKNTNELVYRKGELPSGISRETSYSDPSDKLKNNGYSTALIYEGDWGNGWRLVNHLHYSFDDIDYYSTDGLYYLKGKDAPANTSYYIKDETGANIPIGLDKVSRDPFAFAYDTKSLQNQLELSRELRLGATKQSILMGYNFVSMDMARFDRASYSGSGYLSKVELINPKLDQGPLVATFGREQKYTDKIHALYAQDFLTWGKLSLLAGVRLDFYNSRYRIYDTQGRERQKQTLNQSLQNTALTYRIGLVYNFTEHLNVYASTSNFFRPQRVALSPDVLYADANGNELSPEDLQRMPPLQGQQYEMGLHFDLGNKLSLNASAYVIDLQNVLSSNLGQLPDGRSIGGLMGGARSKGVELELSYSPIRPLTLTASYAYTDAKVSAISTNKLIKHAIPGNYINRVPDHKLTTWGFYTANIDKKTTLLLGLGFEHVGQRFADEGNEYVMKPYSLAHALLSLKWKQWSLQFNAGNLLDKTYHRNAINSVQFIPGEGRNFRITAGFTL